MALWFKKRSLGIPKNVWRDKTISKPINQRPAARPMTPALDVLDQAACRAAVAGDDCEGNDRMVSTFSRVAPDVHLVRRVSVVSFSLSKGRSVPRSLSAGAFSVSRIRAERTVCRPGPDEFQWANTALRIAQARRRRTTRSMTMDKPPVARRPSEVGSGTVRKARPTVLPIPCGPTSVKAPVVVLSV